MKKWFNRVTLPRYFAEWGTDTEEGRQQADRMMRWAASEGFELKTHVLLYPNFIPTRVMALKSSPDQFRRELELAVDDALARTTGTPMVAWDAINELRDSDVIAEVLGQNYYAELFNIANATQPQSRWFINEYGILAGHPTQEKNIADYEAKIRQILDAGGAIEGIGIQGHFQQQLTAMTRVESILDRFAKFGLPIEITEFDIDTKDETTQAEYTKDFLTLVFSHPSTTGFTTWGFWEGSMWRPRGAMIRRDWTVKPNGLIWKKLIYQDWWTNEKNTTNEDGEVSIRVFHGLHELKVHINGKTMTRSVEVGSKGKQLVIRVDE
jgi:endo-1,4-beta-xylanase